MHRPAPGFWNMPRRSRARIFVEAGSLALIGCPGNAGNRDWRVHLRVLRKPERVVSKRHVVDDRIGIAQIAPPETAGIQDGFCGLDLESRIQDQFTDNSERGSALRLNQLSPAHWRIAVFQIEHGRKIAWSKGPGRFQKMI